MVFFIVFTIQKSSLGDDLLVQRRNIFDDDEFDVFSGKTLDASRVHKGKMKLVIFILLFIMLLSKPDIKLLFLLLSRGTADKLLDDKSFIETHKESVMNVAYNIMYEDEYDDTYDTSGLNMRGI